MFWPLIDPKFYTICIRIYWISQFICFCKVIFAITGLAYAHKFADDAVVNVLITYFTDSWKKDKLVNAFGLINLLDGLWRILVIFMKYISKNHVSPRKVIVCSTGSYILGLVLLCISAFQPIPDAETGMYFILVVVLISVGKAGGLPILKEFLGDHIRTHEPKQDINEDRATSRTNFWWITASFFSSVFTVKFFSNASWQTKFVSSVSFLGLGLLLLLCGIPLNPLCHRSLEKDTIAETSDPSHTPKENEDEGREGPSGEMKHRMPLYTMIPMWFSFPVIGMVLSTGNSLFIEQGNNMDPRVSIYVLLMVKDILTVITSFLYNFYKNMSKRNPSEFSLKCFQQLSKRIFRSLTKMDIIVIIWIGLVLSIFCCGVAWRVEVHRLKIIEDEGLCGNPNVTIPLSIVWLLPQLCLLGLFDGFLKCALDDFIEAQVAKSMEGYGSEINEGVIGIGSFLHGFLVYLLRSWFRPTLNCSRLDRYYLLLTIAASANLCYCCFVSIIYIKKKENNAAGEVDA